MCYKVNKEQGPVDINKNRGQKLNQYGAALSVCLGSLASGTVLGWTGNISENLKLSNYNGIKIDDYSLGWIGSLATFGMMISCMPIGKLCDMIGRKAAMLCVTLPFVLGWLLIICANSLTMIYVGRFLTGIAAGAFIVAGPIYTSEIAQKEVRGTLGSYLDLFVTIGILLAYLIGMCLSIRVYTIILCIIPVIFALLFVMQPETPVFRMRQRREADARTALIYFRGRGYDVEPEISAMRPLIIQTTSKHKSSIITSFYKKGTQKAAIASFGLVFFQEASGICAVLFYSDSIFTASGSKLNAQTATAIIGVIQVVATFVSCLLVDRLGRRVLLICSNLFAAISITMLGVFISFEERQLINKDSLSHLESIPLISLSVYIVVYSLGLGPLPLVVMTELLPSEIKGPVTGIAAMFNSLIAFVITKFFFNVKEIVGSDVNFYIFALFAFVGTVFIYFLVPETKGKSLEEIQIELNK